MFTFKGAIFYFLLFIGHITGLVELPKVDDNNILTTETLIRSTINTLFYDLRIKDIKNKPKLKEYSTMHNQFVSFTLQDYNSLKEIAKLTRVDKNKTNTDIDNFMTAMNELLNEDNAENGEIKLNSQEELKQDVEDYVEDFLSQLEALQNEYGNEYVDVRLKENIYNTLKDDDLLLFKNISQEASFNKTRGQEYLLEELTFWRPEHNQIGRRIFHGKRISIKHFPFMASIQIFNSFHCGGSIIKSDLVITASSCLQLAYNNRFFRENPAFLSVRVGNKFYNGGENIPVLEVYFHPNYDPKTLRNNICLIRLLRKIRFKKKSKKGVKKIDFDRCDCALPENTDGITVVGWGAQSSSNNLLNPFRNSLAFSVLDIYPLRECQDTYSKEYVTKKNFCAGFFSKGGGACNRDVGGPGIVNGLLTGIISFGSSICGAADAPTVFTKLGYYTDWIEDIMEQEVPKSYQRSTTRSERLHYASPYYPTTFQIQPVSEPVTPVNILEAETIKALRNTKLFKEFMDTMFDSEEKEQYQDVSEPREKEFETVMAQTKTAIPKIKHVKQIVTPIIKLKPTRMLNSEFHELDSEDSTSSLELRSPENDFDGLSIGDKTDYTIKDYPKEANNDFENVLDKENFDMNKVNLDLNKILDSISKLDGDENTMNPKLFKLFLNEAGNNMVEKKNDSILTLLYLSDSEKKQIKNKKVNKLLMQAKHFQDLTYRNNNKSKIVYNEY